MPTDAFSIGIVAAAIATAIVTVRLKDMLYAAISLAVLSVLVAVMFFRMGSPYAGAFELSVCAGLITALFISVISLTRRR